MLGICRNLVLRLGFLSIKLESMNDDQPDAGRERNRNQWSLGLDEAQLVAITFRGRSSRLARELVLYWVLTQCEKTEATTFIRARTTSPV